MALIGKKAEDQARCSIARFVGPGSFARRITRVHTLLTISEVARQLFAVWQSANVASEFNGRRTMSIGRKIGAFGLTAGLAVSLTFLSALTGGTHTDAAYAKGEGGGNGGGNGGGHGGGHGGSKGGNSSHSGKADSHRSSTNKSISHKSGSVTKSSVTKASATKDKNTLGPLNAAHASATARANAAPNSAVGKIASYEQARDSALAISDPIEREQALDDAKDQLETAFNRTISEKEFSQIDSLLDE